MQPNKIKLTLEAYSIGSDTLLGASTYFMDSSVAAIERITLSPQSTLNGELEIVFPIKEELIKNHYISKKGRIKREVKKLIKGPEVESTRGLHFIDMRGGSPGNWAHILIDHIPISLLIIRESQKYIDGRIAILLPTQVSENTKLLLSDCGIDAHYTDDDISGLEIKFNLSPWISNRGSRTSIVTEELRNSAFRKKVLKHDKLPKKIFISRRDTRKIINEEEIYEILKKAGYTRVYPEDYQAIKQIALISCADSIIAIHGAGLAAIIYRNLFDLPPQKIIEVFSPAHVNNVFRVIAHQIGARWIGIRGRLTRETLDHAYDEPQKIKKYAYEDFFVDPATIHEALNFQHK